MTGAELVPLWESVLKSLEVHVGRIPDDVADLDKSLWQGTFTTPDGPRDESGLSLRALLAHLVIASYEVPNAMVSGTGFGPVKAAGEQLSTLPPSGLHAALVERIPQTLALVGGLDEAALAQPRQLPFGELKVGDALQRALLHLVHHKGQLAQHMRQVGVRPTAFLL